MKKTMSGFTIVELIVVVVVIGILATITVVAYGDFKARSQAAAIEAGLKDIEKSLRVYASDQQWTAWPLDTDIDSGKSGPSIQTLIDDLPEFKKYLQTAPTTSDLPASAWTYDNDGNSKGSCGDNNNGTNILLASVPNKVATYLDASMDDGDFSCGRIRYYTGSGGLSYALSYTDDLNL